MNSHTLSEPLGLRSIIAFVTLALPLSRPAVAQNARDGTQHFKISVVDDQTGRGVPLVELQTTNDIRHYTDSVGVVAFYEPGLMGQEVFFHVKSHGYEYPKDGFGFRGAKLKVTAGGGATLKIKRLNIAERLYRVTGDGIYRDTVLLGERPTIEQPLLNGQVMGQDSVHVAPYRDKLFWIWGDTNRPSYPLGNFAVSGATSEWPRPRGTGLDPSVGVNLRYFVDKSGFSRPMIPPQAIPGPGPKWLGGLTTIRDDDGRERLMAKYVRMKSLGETLERGLVVFNDETESFERLVQFDLDAPLYLDGHPLRAIVGPLTPGPSPPTGEGSRVVPPGANEYLYCGYAAPYAVRVRADMKHVTDPAAYESFTCIVAGGRYEKAATKLDRDADGRLVYGWKPNTPPLSFDQQHALIAAGKMKRDEAWLQLEDIDSGKPVKPHAGSVCWNEFRKRWVMIVEESGGTSLLGEVWFAEADTPVGPWVYAKKIVSHEKYSFYNPTQHPFFDQDGGRLIYFEGTYSDLFSGSPEKTPRYDYNQIMYRLALDDPRLALPAPVYEVRANGGATRYMLRDGVESQNRWDEIERIAFFAVKPNRAGAELVPVYAVPERGGVKLRLEPPAGTRDGAKPIFHVLPPRPSDAERQSDATDVDLSSVVPLYEYHRRDGPPVYSTAPDLRDGSLVRSPDAFCRVWRNPMSSLLLDRGVKAAPIARE